MIQFDYFTLDNGLQVYVHPDKSLPIAVVNILYNVGSRDEDEDKTGFAHLFEHLMFGGSKNIASYDDELQKAGGENNAFTSPDITNYYITLPASNIETAFWLESDRMLSLSFDQKVLEVQQNVVIEEFKQRYLNQPYGDVWLHLRPLAYTSHPYRWPTIGKDINHIQDANIQDVKDFFYKYYIPNNAIMVVAGDVSTEQIKRLSEKWFGPIPAGKKYKRQLPIEPKQTTARSLEMAAKVPLDGLYKVYHMEGKISPTFYTADLIGDMLGRGKSSRLYSGLVKEQRLFNSINAHVNGSIEPGLLIIEGKLNKGVSLEAGNKAIEDILEEIKSELVPADELTKVKNQAESSHIFGEVEILNRAMNIAFAAELGDVNLVNEEPALIQDVTQEKVRTLAQTILSKDNCSTLFYQASNPS
ncbi:MAG TPA: pitrilysin family protein [Cytophagaceae bacterium]|jgi:predicted Zn-dependent peptidase